MVLRWRGVASAHNGMAGCRVPVFVLHGYSAVYHHYFPGIKVRKAM